MNQTILQNMTCTICTNNKFLNSHRFSQTQTKGHPKQRSWNLVTRIPTENIGNLLSMDKQRFQIYVGLRLGCVICQTSETSVDRHQMKKQYFHYLVQQVRVVFSDKLKLITLLIALASINRLSLHSQIHLPRNDDKQPYETTNNNHSMDSV